MTNFQKFKRRLKSHPGVPLAALYMLGGGAIALSKPHPTVANVAGSMLALSIFWIPVLLTAWKDRNIE